MIFLICSLEFAAARTFVNSADAKGGLFPFSAVKYVSPHKAAEGGKGPKSKRKSLSFQDQTVFPEIQHKKVSCFSSISSTPDHLSAIFSS